MIYTTRNNYLKADDDQGVPCILWFDNRIQMTITLEFISYLHKTTYSYYNVLVGCHTIARPNPDKPCILLGFWSNINIWRKNIEFLNWNI